jgi:3-mercaptopyruvate sulfurtransferase SseA
MAAALVAVTAGAQYKTPVQQPPTKPSTVQIAPNNSVQISTSAAADKEVSTARRITRDEALKLVKQGKAVYVDVRSKDSYDEGHLPGAISIPLSQLQSRLRDLPPKKTLITYCA